MKHLGDITKIDGSKVEPVHIITGGSPCQDLSVAGLRKGLAGERSGLYMEQIRIIKEMREHGREMDSNNNIRYTCGRYMVWENVAGALSSNKGEDFRVVLEEAAKVVDKDAIIPGPPNGKWNMSGCIVGNGWSIAWRLHDAQYWGVAQRRQRICMVCDFDGESAGRILFENSIWSKADYTNYLETIADPQNKPGRKVQSVGKGLSGNLELRGEEKQDSTTESESRLGASSIYDVRISSLKTKNWRAHCYETEISRCLDINEPSPDGNQGGLYIINDKPTTIFGKDITPTLVSRISTAVGNTQDALCIVDPTYGIEPGAAKRLGGYVSEDIAPTLRANMGDNQTSVAYEVDCYNQSQTEEQAKALTSKATDSDHIPCVYSIDRNVGIGKDVAPTLTTTHGGKLAIYGMDNERRRGIDEFEGVSPTLTQRMGTGGNNTPCVIKEPTLLESNQNHAAIQENGVSTCLPASTGMGGGYVPMVVEEPTCYDRFSKRRNGIPKECGSIAPTITAACGESGNNTPIVSVDALDTFHQDVSRDKALTLKARNYKDPQCVCFDAYQHSGIKAMHSVVRRLTPLECERLQGFPDYWTDIGDWTDSNGKLHKGDSASPRYKALGNSIALPFWRWLAKRILAELNVEDPKMASLFSGIGGFELVFAENGCKPVWASEIEEFPIAVTKVRFPE